MLFISMLLLALTNLLTLAVAGWPAEKSADEESHTSAVDMAAPAAVAKASIVPHYVGSDVAAHVPADVAANITWMDHSPGEPLGTRGAACSAADGLDCQGVYVCSEKNYIGSCCRQQAGGGSCHSYPYTRASSFGVDMNLQCTVFQQSNCKGNHFTDLTWPGVGDLTPWTLTWWGTKHGSYMCRYCVGCINGNAPDWTIN